MKSKEELTALKVEFEAVSRKLRELTEDELAQVAGGIEPNDSYCGVYEIVEKLMETIKDLKEQANKPS